MQSALFSKFFLQNGPELPGKGSPAPITSWKETKYQIDLRDGRRYQQKCAHFSRVFSSTKNRKSVLKYPENVLLLGGFSGPAGVLII